MRHPWLNLRMLLVSVVLLLLYVPALFVAYKLGAPLHYIAVGFGVMLFLEYWVGKRRALASVKTVSWDEVDSDAIRELEERLQAHCESMGVAVPELHFGIMGSPNAFAVGRRGHGHVVLSKQLVELLTLRELEAVLVHELSHLHSRDCIPPVIGEGSSRVFGLVLSPIAMMVAAILSAFTSASERETYESIEAGILHAGDTLVRYAMFAISRQREFIADRDAQREIGGGEPLKRALLKIENHAFRSVTQSPPEEVETLCISSDWSLKGLGSTHPPIDVRVERLDELDGREH